MTEVNQVNNETTVGYRSLKKVIRSFTSTDEVENRATKIDEKKLGRHTAQCSKIDKNHKVGLHQLFPMKIPKNEEETTPLLHSNSY